MPALTGRGVLQRFNMQSTSSFAQLPEGWRNDLAWLHDDYYYGRQDALWKGNALRTLPTLQGGSNMLVCGEDLGMIPACVPPIMEQLGLIGTLQHA